MPITWYTDRACDGDEMPLDFERVTPVAVGKEAAGRPG